MNASYKISLNTYQYGRLGGWAASRLQSGVSISTPSDNPIKYANDFNTYIRMLDQRVQTVWSNTILVTHSMYIFLFCAKYNEKFTKQSRKCDAIMILECVSGTLIRMNSQFLQSADDGPTK